MFKISVEPLSMQGVVVHTWTKFFPIGSLSKFSCKMFCYGPRKGSPIEHSIEGRDLVNTHGWHLKKFSNIVHDANARPTLVLSLTKVEERDDSSLLVLRRVFRNDFVRTFHILGSELKGDLVYMKLVLQRIRKPS